MRRTGCDRRALDASESCAPVRVEAGELPRLGWVWVAREPTGALRELHLAGLAGSEIPRTARDLDEDLREALESYERGSDHALWALPLAPARTSFAALVRGAMRAIPRGEVRTYGQLAVAVGGPGAARAVGRACATNPLPLVVPCHRVVASTGPGGFGPGLEAKRLLWALEGMGVAMRAGFR